MGFSYDKSTVQEFIDFFDKLPSLMTFLETPSVLTADDVQRFLDLT